MIGSPILNEILEAIPHLTLFHSPQSPVYRSLKVAAREEIEQLFSFSIPIPIGFGPFGPLVFPYREMGFVDTLNLFDFDELIIFCFYWANREKYKRVLDLGANLGLHSIIMDRCGFEVCAYEPDPSHFAILGRNLEMNCCDKVQAIKAAVSIDSGKKEFVKVLDNTTSSHLADSKANPYGDLERFRVDTKPMVLQGVDLVKMDIEGHEATVLLMTKQNDWQQTDAIVEIQNPQNAEAVYGHFSNLGVNLFSQKNNWHRVHSTDDMPTSYRDGSLFITSKDQMPWS